MENRTKNKWIVEASFMAAIIFILMMLTASPMFDIIGSFIVPIPITILYLRHGKKAAWLSVIVGGVLAALFYTPLMIVNVIIIYGPLGVTLGYCIKKEKSVAKTIGFLAIINGVGTVINYTLMFTVLSGITLTQYLQQFVDVFHQTANMASSMGQSSASMQQVIELYKSINVDFLLMILPIGFILSVIISAFLNFVIARGILRRLGFKVKSLPPFSRWYLDNRISAILIILFCLSYIMKANNVLYSESFFMTMIYLLMFVFMIQSLSVIAYFLKNTLKLSNPLIVFTEIIIIISPLSLYIIAIGIGDLIMDIRGVDPNSLKNFIKGKINKN
ncbi:MAG: YybS family protein [Clostridium perfringens]|nr:YybS family protein [Clostridium perfringens]